MAVKGITKAAQEAAVLEALKETRGYFSIYWAMQTQYRAAALARLESRGEIMTERMAFPLCQATIKAGL